MRHHRHLESTVLGYRIECVRQLDSDGDVTIHWYEVLAPDTLALLGTFAHRSEAERDIVARELALLPRTVAA